MVDWIGALALAGDLLALLLLLPLLLALFPKGSEAGMKGRAGINERSRIIEAKKRSEASAMKMYLSVAFKRVFCVGTL